MNVFTEAEIAYLASQRLARLATVGGDGQPHVVPVGFRYNPEFDTIDVGGRGFGTSKKFRDILRNPRVALVVDDVPSEGPWAVRGIEIRGEAEALMSGGEQMRPGFDPEMARIRVKRVLTWGFGANGGGAPPRV